MGVTAKAIVNDMFFEHVKMHKKKKNVSGTYDLKTTKENKQKTISC